MYPTPVVTATGLKKWAWNGREAIFLSERLELNSSGDLDYVEILGDIWTDINITNLYQEGGVDFKNGKKQEELIRRFIEMSTNEGDLVLDSFGGSGTTGAVAHKMKRRWIMVELGEHCYTHIVPRLQKVIDGTDTGGITKAATWKGGGGFRFYELAPSLLKKDKYDNYIINPEYNAEMLAEAMCKHLGFTYQPSDSIYWQHGIGNESDYIYVTTQTLSREMLEKLSDEVGNERSLLVCCKAFRGGANEFENLTLKKIPNTILGRCEWDKDDYSLKIQNLPMKDIWEEAKEAKAEEKKGKVNDDLPLFNAE
jgi:adenine-specific DNA-methyltransferase